MNIPVSRRNTVYLVVVLLVLSLFGISITRLYTHRFDGSKFNAGQVYDHITELSSSRYQGRLAGSPGNQLALRYVENYFKQIGLEPAGENNTYYQDFKSFVPVYNSEPFFRVVDKKGRVIKSYRLSDDYFEVLSGYGAGGDAAVELFVPAKNVTSYSKAELKGKVVLVPAVRDKETEYAIDAGVRGIITAAPELKRTPVPLEEKKGKSTLMLSLQAEKFAELKALGSQQPLSVQIHLDVPYKLVNTPNILAKINGTHRNDFLIISAHVDGLGSTINGKFFPGAMDGASGTGVLLELAKTLKAQRIIPEKTIIFAVWNNEEFGQKGSQYYTEHPLYPLDKSRVILLDNLGGKLSNEVTFSSAGGPGVAFADTVRQYAADTKLKTGLYQGVERIGPDQEAFVTKNIPSVQVMSAVRDNYGTLYNLQSFGETVEYIGTDQLRAIGLALLNYFRVEVYASYYPEYLTVWNIGITTVYILGLVLLYLVFRLFKANPKFRLLTWSVADIYYSLPFNLILKAYYYITPVLAIFLSLVFICNVPINFILVTTDNGNLSNFSWYLVIKQSIMYTQELFTSGLGTSKSNINVMDVLGGAFVKSSLLLLVALVVSFVVGIAKGLKDGYRIKSKTGMGSIGTIVTLSVPDVLIVILIQLLLIYLNQHDFALWLVRSGVVRTFFVPLLCLAVLPSVYIARIVSTTVQEEIHKDYMQVARAKGLSHVRIVFNHLLIVVVLRVVDSLSSVLTLMISNLIIVEYLCYYPGIVYGLMQYYERNDTVPFIGFAISLGLIYICFNLMFKGLARLINPFKREGAY